MKPVLLLALVFLLSCHGKEPVKKYHVIPVDSFVDVLIDYHLAEAFLSTDYYRVKMKDQKEVNISDSVLKEHGYNKAVFDSSVSYYSSNPELYDKIYEEVITRLNRMQAEAQKQMKKDTSKTKIK
jgi:hypothetical protein